MSYKTGKIRLGSLILKKYLDATIKCIRKPT